MVSGVLGGGGPGGAGCLQRRAPGGGAGEACDSGDNLIAKQAMRKVVPTFKSPEEVNCHVANEKQEEKAEEKVEVYKKPGMKAAIF